MTRPQTTADGKTSFQPEFFSGLLGLGDGDVIIPQEQRLLGGMTGANGFLMFGLMTAMLTDTLRDVRGVQQKLRDQNVEDTGVSCR